MTTVRDTVKALLPDAAVARVQQRLAERASRARQIDLGRARLIREAPIEKLADPAYLEHDLLPRLGLNDELLHEFPESLHSHTGEGLRHWQYPNQFSKYLAELSGRRIETYLEIGVRHGGTFVITVEYLSRFHPVREAIAVDLQRAPALLQYAQERPAVSVIEADSQTEEFRAFVRDHAPFDLALIDGDHSEEGCRRDFETVADHARVIVFHDIVSHPVPGVGAVWRQVRSSHADRFDFLEFTDQYPELSDRTGHRYLGIGVAVAREGP